MSKYTGNITIFDDEGNTVFERELTSDQIIDQLLSREEIIISGDPMPPIIIPPSIEAKKEKAPKKSGGGDSKGEGIRMPKLPPKRAQQQNMPRDHRHPEGPRRIRRAPRLLRIVAARPAQGILRRGGEGKAEPESSHHRQPARVQRADVESRKDVAAARAGGHRQQQHGPRARGGSADQSVGRLSGLSHHRLI